MKNLTFLKQKSFFKTMLLAVILLAGSGSAWGQPWTYNFGTTTGTFTSGTASTTFLPTPTSGTARVRCGATSPSISMENPGLTALGTETELKITSGTGSTSTTKFSIYDYTADKEGYVKFKIVFFGGTNGVYKFSLGDGATFSDNNAINTAQIFAGIEWTLGASNTISYKVLNASTYGTTGISNSTSLFVQNTSTVYQVEIYANNTTATKNYLRSGTSYSLANATWDLWVDGTRVGTGLAKGGIGTDANIDSYAFNHQTSVSAPGTIYLDDIEYSNVLPVSSTPTVVTPTFNPAGGSYLTSQSVSISTTTPSSSIYYTTDGTDPNNAGNGTLYSAPIAVSATTTIKARAYATGFDPSAVASATYSLPTVVADIATLRSQATGTTRYKLTGQAALTYQSAAGKVKYIQDATGAIVITDPSGIITTTYNLYDGITGITGTLATVNSMLQFTPVADPGAATATGLTVIPTEVTLNNLTTAYQAKLVKIKNVTFGITGSFATGTNYTISDPISNTGVMRTQYTDLNYISTSIPTIAQDITGVVLQYNSTIEIIPRSTTDFVNSPVAVTFNVDMNGTSGYTDVYVAGSFNSWSPTASKMTTSGGNIYTFTTDRTINIGDVIEFKIVKDGSIWETIANRTYTAVAGTNTVNVYWDATTLPQLDFVNLQYPPTATIVSGNSLDVFAQVYEPGLTEAAGQGADITAWVGYSTTDTNPNTWTNWVLATFNKQSDNNDEYKAIVGSALAGGKYYYASRFKYGLNDYVYGGLNGLWDATNSKSGVLTVIATEPAAHITNPAAIPNSSTEITLNWTDATANGYLIKGSAVSFDDIAAPVDGVAEVNGTLVCNVTSGTQTYKFTGLTAETTYYFKLFPYNGSGEQINYKVDGSVPQATATTYKAPTELQAGDIAILQVNTSTTDRFSFVTFVDLTPGTIISFTDNGYSSTTAVNTNEGIKTYTASAFVPAGTVLTWVSGTTDTNWTSSGGFSLAGSGDQLFAFQGTWNSNQKLIYGVNTRPWLTTGTPDSNNSYLPADLTDNVTTFAFGSVADNAYYTGLTNGTRNVISSLIANNSYWTTSASNQGAQSWTFSLGNSTTLSSNTNIYQLVIASGESLTLNPDKQLTVAGAFTNNGTFTVQSGATVITNGTVSGSGTTNVEQSFTGDGRSWWYVSSPLTAANSNVFRPEESSNLIGDYNEATTSYSATSFGANSSTPLVAGKGYAVKFESTTGGTYTFTGGLLNTGNVSLTPTRTGTAAKRGFNLVGNPYPSYLNWNAVYADATNPAVNMRNAIWLRTYDKEKNAMVFYTYGDGDGVPEITSPLIAPMQAFWVKVNADGSNGSLTFKNTHRSHFTEGANPLKVKASEIRPRLRMVVSNGTNSDEMLIVGKSYASNSLDSYDIEKMSADNTAIPEIYSVLDNNELVINSMNTLTEGSTVNLGFRPGKIGSFTIEATQLENIDAKVMLLDKVAVTEQELTAGIPYTFSVEDAAATNDRFVVKLVSKVPTGIEVGNASRDLTVFTNRNNRIQVIYNGEISAQTAVSVYNVAGQKLNTQKITKAATELNGNFRPGVYMVQFTDNKKNITQKLVIN